MIHIHLGIRERRRKQRLSTFNLCAERRLLVVRHTLRRYRISRRQIHRLERHRIEVHITTVRKRRRRQLDVQKVEPIFVFPFTRSDRVMQQNQRATTLRILDKLMLRRDLQLTMQVHPHCAIAGQRSRHLKLPDIPRMHLRVSFQVRSQHLHSMEFVSHNQHILRPAPRCNDTARDESKNKST